MRRVRARPTVAPHMLQNALHSGPKHSPCHSAPGHLRRCIPCCTPPDWEGHQLASFSLLWHLLYILWWHQNLPHLLFWTYTTRCACFNCLIVSSPLLGTLKSLTLLHLEALLLFCFGPTQQIYCHEYPQ